jgi:uncharacterized protein Yka (UPF0111/DUF47 family)
MFSLQRLLGEDKRFLRLLEASAMEAAQSVAALRALLADEKNKPTLKTFATLRHKEKDIMNQIADLLVRALVVAMEREDIEALADSLYRIPKTVEKFAERYIISSAQVGDVDFSRQLDLMQRGCQHVGQMIQELRSGAKLNRLKQLNANIQKIESDADDVILEFVAQLYQPDFPKLKAIILKDLFELNEKVVDRCRDAGNVIVRVALKNS